MDLTSFCPEKKCGGSKSSFCGSRIRMKFGEPEVDSASVQPKIVVGKLLHDTRVVFVEF